MHVPLLTQLHTRLEASYALMCKLISTYIDLFYTMLNNYCEHTVRVGAFKRDTPKIMHVVLEAY